MEAASLLLGMVSDPLHVYLASLPSPVGDEFRGVFDPLLGSKQVMDAYLLNLARQHKATFMTFDSRLREMARAGTEIEILGA